MTYLILLLIFILAIFQGAFLSLNLVLLFILFWSSLRPTKEALIIAFISGILLDLAKGGLLGFSSLLLVSASFLMKLYSRRFQTRYFLYLPIFVFLISGLWSFINNRTFDWPQALILAILALLLAIPFRFLPVDFLEEEKKLRI